MNIFFAPIEKLTHYLDPGTGSMVLQVLLAALLSVGVLVKVFWRKYAAGSIRTETLYGLTSTQPKLSSRNPPRTTRTTA